MPIDSFKFISPGVFVNEIDNSESPQPLVTQNGPVIIGRSKMGPANRPIMVNDFEEFVSIFGEPNPGGSLVGDTWRDGNNSSTTYAAYAAEAWLSNNQPLTFVRLLGEQHEDATADGYAGWKTAGIPTGDEATNAGAFGLFIVDNNEATHVSGALAAIFYLDEGSIVLSGSDTSDTSTEGANTLIKSVGSSYEFNAIIRDSTGTTIKEASFNFNRSSSKYIRKVFNTNPILTNGDVVSDPTTYWLGESFEQHVSKYVENDGAGLCFGVILPLAGPSAVTEGEGSNFEYPSQNGKTGWFFSQDLGSNSADYDADNMQKLFRIHSLYSGDWTSKNVKISISDIKPSTSGIDPYGTFTVLVRSASDTDELPKILEQYNNCDLNPSSPNFVALRIGDKQLVWSDLEKKYTEVGIYNNVSKYIRIELDESVLDGLHNPSVLPFGVYGPPRYKTFAFTSGSSGPLTNDTLSDFTGAMASGSAPRNNQVAGEFINTPGFDFTGSFVYPELQLRSKASDGALPNLFKAYYGVQNTKGAGSTNYDEGYVDYVRPLAKAYKDLTESEWTEYSWIFTLDDISGSSVNRPAEYVAGSRVAGTSFTATGNTWQDVIEAGHNRFTAPIHGGFDGFDVSEMEPLRNNLITGTPTEEANYVFYTYKRAINAVSNPEVVGMNLVAIPGLTNKSLTGLLANICEQRGDALAIIDPEGGYVARPESKDSYEQRLGDTNTIVRNMKERGLNTSYAAAYDPWIISRDARNGQRIYLPPSVAAIGAMSTTDKNAGPWFAPAGFTRGGLSKGDAGINVIGVTRKLLSDDRDKLYDARINPIASMPSVGITIWGQKTLLPSKTSALNRVNVRRMMIYVKRAISQVAAQTLFEPNVRDTWNSFIASATPILNNVQSRFGINEYKLILDESTTTPDLIDRNIVYAKIIIKPTRAIEFFAIDFVLTNTGAGFDD